MNKRIKVKSVEELKMRVTNAFFKKDDSIERIVLDYHRIDRYNSQPDDEFYEHLIIDRDSGSVEFIKEINSSTKESYRYEEANDIKRLLDDFYQTNILLKTRGNSKDTIHSSKSSKTYQISITYRSQKTKIITGTFDKNGLPKDYDRFILSISHLFAIYLGMDITTESIFNKEYPKKGEYIYLSVEFDESYKTYYYLTNDDTIEKGDEVEVPVGDDNNIEIAYVKKVEYFKKSKVPFPLNNTKWIIGKVD